MEDLKDFEEFEESLISKNSNDSLNGCANFSNPEQLLNSYSEYSEHIFHTHQEALDFCKKKRLTPFEPAQISRTSWKVVINTSFDDVLDQEFLCGGLSPPEWDVPTDEETDNLDRDFD